MSPPTDPLAFQLTSVSNDDVRMAYRLFLGRDAENEEVVSRTALKASTISELRRLFVSSKEFEAKTPGLLRSAGHKPLDWAAISVEAEVSEQELEQMIQHVERNWQILGETEPHWSVLTTAAYRSENIAENLEGFYATGQRSVSYVQAAIARSGAKLNTGGTCFELGCGVGRVTIALSDIFTKVIASDISRSHLQLARTASTEQGKANIEFVHISSMISFDEIPSFDFFFSVIVLQHNPPPVIKALISSIFKKLYPGGLAYFQVPTYAVDYSFSSKEYLSGMKSKGTMEVHVLPQHEIFRLADQNSCEILEVREDGWTGSPKFISNSFLIRKLA